MLEPVEDQGSIEKAGAGAAPAKDSPFGVVKPLPPAISYPLAVLTGLLYFLAFPGVNLWPLAFVALVPLIVALRGQTPRRALGLGWAAGFTMTMCGFYWLLEMLKVFSGFGPGLCFIFMALLCAYQAGRIGLLGWLYGRAEGRGWPAAPVFMAAFVGSELCFPLLFPWYYGATVHNAVVFLQVADLGGPYLVAVVLVAANLGVAELVLARREQRTLNRLVLGSAVALPVLAVLYGYPRLRQVDSAASAAQPVKVGIVQGNMPLQGKQRRFSLGIHQARTEELRSKGVDLVVWSEGATGMANLDEPGYGGVRQSVTGRLKIPAIVGTVLATPTTKDNYEYHNVALLADKEGVVQGRYDKQYLLAFGEFLPFGKTFPVLYRWSPESSEFAPGTSLEPLPFGDHRIAALICYEDILPAFVNSVVRHADPDLLVNLTNDAWFGNSTEPWIHLALAKLRAVEHRRYLVRATNSGVSAIIDPVGRVPMHGGTFKEESLIGVAKFMRSKTVYEKLGDAPWLLVTLAAFGMALVRRPKTQPPSRAA